MKKRGIFSTGIAAGIAATTGAANAGMTGPEAFGGVIQPGATGFIAIDLETGVSDIIREQVGPAGTLPSFTGMDFDSSTGILYAIERTFDNLVSIDPSTGDFNVIGSLGIETVGGGAAYDSNSGTFYYSSTSTDFTEMNLHSIDVTTGAATVIGGFDVFALQGLAFDTSTNTLYGTDGISDSLYTVDTTTGATTLVGEFGVGISDHGLDFNDATGELILSGGSAMGNNFLWNVDVTTGLLTRGAPLEFGAASLAIVPAPGTFALIGLGGALATRRRRA